uniref:hypothetical protein n=1 Tax=Pseudomonas urethralis TaxID=2740517 RepID=UPI001596B2FB
GSNNLLHTDNDMAQSRFEHLLNDNWTLGGGRKWLHGSLKGNAVAANGLQAVGFHRVALERAVQPLQATAQR